MQQIRSASQNKKASKFESLLICNSKMVREIDATWNPIYDSILLMYQKLRDLGFVYRDGGITVSELQRQTRQNNPCHSVRKSREL